MRTVTSKWEVLRSDRTDLLYAAVELFKYRLQQDTHNDLLPCEHKAYEAAMDFLEREFVRGPSKTESHIAESIDEVTEESAE